MTVFYSVKRGFEYILLIKSGFIYLIYFFLLFRDRLNNLFPVDILMFVGLLGFIAYFANPLEFSKKKCENLSVSNSYSGFAQLYLMFIIMIFQYYSQDHFIEITFGTLFKTWYFWLCFVACMTILFFVLNKYDKAELTIYDSYKKNPDFKKVLALSIIPFVFTSIMTAYISAYCINYVFDRSLPKEVAFEIENVYEQKIKGKKSEIITFHANLKTEYSSVKSINITPDEFKAYRVGDSIKYKLYEGFLGTPYLKKIK